MKNTIQQHLNTTTTATPEKFYLTKNKKYQKYYVLISKYDTETKKNYNKYKSLKTNNKQIALLKFNDFVNSYLNKVSETTINKNITFEDFVSEIIPQLKANLNKNTVSIYNLTIKKFIEIIGNKMLKMITIKDIENFKIQRLNQNVSKFEVNKELSTLKAILNIAIKLNYLQKNASKYVKKYSIEDKKIKVFSDIEIQLLLNNIKNKTLLNIVKFATITGLRLNEILNIKTSDIDIQNEIINIYQSKTKKNKICIITNKLKSFLLNEILNTSPATHLNNIYELNNNNTPDKYLFTVMNRNTAINKSYISKLFKKELRKLNFNEDLHFHNLRHSYISNLINKGTPLNFVKEIVQHSNIATTMKYITLNKTEILRYANNI